MIFSLLFRIMNWIHSRPHSRFLHFPPIFLAQVQSQFTPKWFDVRSPPLYPRVLRGCDLSRRQSDCCLSVLWDFLRNMCIIFFSLYLLTPVAFMAFRILRLIHQNTHTNFSFRCCQSFAPDSSPHPPRDLFLLFSSTSVCSSAVLHVDVLVCPSLCSLQRSGRTGVIAAAGNLV